MLIEIDGGAREGFQFGVWRTRNGRLGMSPLVMKSMRLGNQTSSKLQWQPFNTYRTTKINFLRQIWSWFSQCSDFFTVLFFSSVMNRWCSWEWDIFLTLQWHPTIVHSSNNDTGKRHFPSWTSSSSIVTCCTTFQNYMGKTRFSPPATRRWG